MLQRHTVRLARQDVLWAVAAFVLLQLGLAVAIEGWLPQFRDPYYAYRAARLLRRYRAEPRPLSVLVLGSSQVQDGLMPALLEEPATEQMGRPVMVFNFGVPAAGPVVHLLNYRRLRAAGFRPDLLLLEVAPICLSEEGSSPAASGLVADRLEWSELTWLGRYGLPVGDLVRDWWERCLVPTHGHRFVLLGRFAPDLVPAPLRQDWARHVDDSGWQEPMVSAIAPERRRRNIEADCADYRPFLARFRFGPSPCRALEDLLEECRRDAVAVALIRMPETAAFRRCFPPAVEQRINGYLDELQRRYALPCIDARASVADDGFRDAHHLLVAGARVFTIRLGKEILFPALGRWRTKGKIVVKPPPARYLRAIGQQSDSIGTSCGSNPTFLEDQP